MSWSEEFGAEETAEAEAFAERIRKAAEGGIWTMRDGTKIHVSQMTDGHIRNTICMLKRNDVADLYLPWIEQLQKELDGRQEVVVVNGTRRASDMSVPEAMAILNAFPIDMRKPGAFNVISAMTVVENALKNSVSKDAVLALKQEIGAYGMDISSQDVEKLPTLLFDERGLRKKENEERER